MFIIIVAIKFDTAIIAAVDVTLLLVFYYFFHHRCNTVLNYIIFNILFVILSPIKVCCYHSEFIRCYEIWPPLPSWFFPAQWLPRLGGVSIAVK